MGQKYLFALKLSSFDDLRRTPLRFVELHAGYFARGYRDIDAQLGISRERHLYAGIGLNLNEILFSNPSVRGTVFGGVACRRRRQTGRDAGVSQAARNR